MFVAMRRGFPDCPARMAPVSKITSVTINRAPVLTLWAAIVAERLGFARAEALTLGKSMAGLNAQSKGRALGIFSAAGRGSAWRKRGEVKPGESLTVSLLGREVPAVETTDGVRATISGKPISPESVERYLESKFKESLGAAREAMESLADSMSQAELVSGAMDLYAEFRPAIPRGKKGWGAAGVLDLDLVRALAGRRRS
jgi:hypothetical protein